MNEFLKKHWTSLIGTLFVMASLLTLFKYSADQGWLSDPIKIGIGLLSAAGLMLPGMLLHLRNGRFAVGELICGLGVAIWFATCSYAGIYTPLWDSMTVLLSMLAVTIGISIFSYKYNSRILSSVGLLGALVAPIVMRPETDQVFTLFLYLFVVNAAFIYMSVRKSWLELRLTGFVLTWVLYAVYFIHFNPVTEGLWSKPLRYAVAAFLFYTIAYFVALWKERERGCNQAGINLYITFANTVLFAIWATVILQGKLAASVVLIAIGLLYFLLAAGMKRFSKDQIVPFYLHLAAGALLLLIGMSQLGNGWELRPMIAVYVWTFIASGVLAVGIRCQWDALKAAATAIWMIVCVYWYTVTWDVPRLNWFEAYVPFLNGGAVVWVLLAAFGFYFSHKVRYQAFNDKDNALVSNLYSIISHIIVAGLLTIQIENMYEEYALAQSSEPLTLSIIWGLYALSLFLWGAFSRQRIYRIFGSIVLGLVALKAIFLDLAGEDSIYKIITFLLLGIICFGITVINQKWRDEGPAINGKE